MAPHPKAPHIDAAIVSNMRRIDRLHALRELVAILKGNVLRDCDHLDLTAQNLQDELQQQNRDLEKRKALAPRPTVGTAA